MIEKLIQKWWFYLIILVLAFIPSITQTPISPDQIQSVVKEVLQAPLIYEIEILFPLAKILLLFACLSVIIWKNKARLIFSILISTLLLPVAIFQNISLDTQFGYAILTGNIVVQLIMVFFWLYEIRKQENDFSKLKIKWWKILLLIFAFLAFWMPAKNGLMHFRIRNLLLNEAGLTFCMITPVILAFLLLYYPTVNKATLRITAFIGLYFGIINSIAWFTINPEYWWMGILHLPLLVISFIALFLSKVMK